MAQVEHITPTEAAVQLIQSGLKSTKRKAWRKIKEADVETLRQNVPFFAFMGKLPEDVVKGMEVASKQFQA